MKKLILTYLTFGIFSIFCNSQSIKVEDKLINCVYQNYEDNGTKFKKALTEFEQLLINENILKDSSGKSYIIIFEKIIEENDFKYNPSESFLDKIIDIGMPKLESFNKCQSELKESEFSKNNELRKIFDALKESGNFSQSTIVRKLPEIQEEDIEYDISKSINIYIDRENQIFVNKEKVDIDALKTAVRNYEEKNKSESIISLKTERETMYSTYINVQNAVVGEIKKLRTRLAEERYNKELKNLTKEEMTEIKKVYPLKLIE